MSAEKLEGLKQKHLVTEGYLDVRLQEAEEEIKTEIKDEIRGETAKILQGVDKIITRFDIAEKDHAADKLLHDRHEKRLEKLEVKVF